MKIIIEGSHSRLAGFRYFWLKKVVGFNDTHHCAKCLDGSYRREVSPKMLLNSAVEVPSKDGDVFYLCGVSVPYRWDNNFHCAFMVKSDSSTTVPMYNGNNVRIEGAIQLQFDDKKARELYPNKPESFLTCRNFQFGAHYLRQLW